MKFSVSKIFCPYIKPRNLLFALILPILCLFIQACDETPPTPDGKATSKNLSEFSRTLNIAQSESEEEEVLEPAPEKEYKIVYFRYNDGASNALRYEAEITQTQLDSGYFLLNFSQLNAQDGNYFWIDDKGGSYDSLAVGDGFAFSSWDNAPTVLASTLPDPNFAAGAQISQSDFNSDGILYLYPVWSTAISVDTSQNIRASLHILIPTEAWEMSEIIPHSALDSQTYYNKVGYVNFSQEAFIDPFNGQFLGYGYEDATHRWVTRSGDTTGRGVAQYDGKDDSTPGKSVEDFITSGVGDYSAGSPILKQLLLKMDDDGYLQDYVYYDEVLEDIADNGVVDYFSVDFYKIIYAQSSASTNPSTGLISEQYHVDSMLVYDKTQYEISFVEPNIEGSALTGATIQTDTISHGEALPFSPTNWHTLETPPENYEFVGWKVLNDDGSTGVSYEEYAEKNPTVSDNITFVSVLSALEPKILSDELSKTYDAETLSYTAQNLWDRVLAEEFSGRFSTYEEMLSEYTVITNDASGSTGRFAGPNVGEVVFTYSILNNASNLSIYDVQIKLSIQKAPLVVSPMQNYSKIFGSADPVFEYKIEGLAKTDTAQKVFSSISAKRASEGENYGEYDIEVDYTPNTQIDSKFGNYDIVTNTALLLILRSDQIGAVAEPIVRTYDGKSHTIDVDVLGAADGEPVEIYYNLTGALGAYTHSEPPTVTDVNESQEIYFMVKSPNYEAYFGSARVTVNPAPASIRANSYTKTQGEEDPEFSASVSGVVEGETLNYTIDRLAGEDPGDYTITPVERNNPNYDVSINTGLLTIEAVQSISPSATAPKEPSGKNLPEIVLDADNNIIIAPVMDSAPQVVQIDGISLGEGDYSVDENGLVQLSSAVFSNLPDGEHSIRVQYDEEVFESIIIVDNGIPLSAGNFKLVESDYFWSLFNLLCTLFSVAFACIFLIRHKLKGDLKPQNLRVGIALAGFAGICFAVLFITQNFSASMTFFDAYSLVFAFSVFAQIVLRVFFAKTAENSPQVKDN